MGLLTDILSGGVANLFKTVMDEIKLDPQKKADMQMQLAQMEAAAEQADKDLDAKLNDIAGQNIRTDSSSNDSFVRRARPYFLWIMGTAIGVDLLIFPLVNLATGRGLTPLILPDVYISLYKVAFLGYVTARTAEKIKGSA